MILTVSCDHVYCLECIREWRKNKSSGSSLASPFNSDRNSHRPVSPSGSSTTSSSTADLGPTKTCPLCRTPSPYIIPSSIYPATAQDKTVMNDRYKASLSRIPCRYFEQSNRNRRTCLFGDDCFFRHAEAVAPDVRVPVERPRGGRRVNRGGWGGGGRFLRLDDWGYPDMQTELNLMIDMATETAYRATGWGDHPDDPVSGEDELARMLEMMMLGEMMAASEAAGAERERNTQRAQRERESYEEWDGNGDVPSGRWVRMGDWGIYRAEPGARGGGSRGGRRRGRGRGRGPASVSYVVGREQYEYGRVSNDDEASW
ncbi:hypothetical protein BC936DRAFT_145319 [Jimgerdemannia flammicorona]|uniref:C3H1-type domain-containing protein n=1 Tax=Jimgerdemannia flammicorona TaxID=994334 RepID=A0A433DAG4_9FUNG|nr:hypothetical protein BC936DRAFT_145319 [Jimgerdemannia flammicorona]